MALHIQLVTITYPPEIGGAAHLIHELAVCLKEKGHQVSVLTGYPTYNLRETPPQYRNGSRMEEVVDGVTVRRVRFPSLPRNSMIARGLQHFIYAIWLGFLLIAGPKADVIVAFSPPLPLPWMVEMIAKIWRRPVVVNIQDLFPREAVELGVLTNKMLIGLFERMERQVHHMAAAVTVHSPGNQQHVIAHGGKAGQVHVVYNWVNTGQIRPGRQDNEFARANGLLDKYVVSYAGTMGWAQDMGTIITSAVILRDQKDLLFLLVGDGVEKEKAQARCAELGLSNILWMPMQPLSLYPEILAASNISLINLHPELRTPVVPSKLLSIMAAGRPVVASLPAESDARLIVRDACCGICVNAGDGQALASAILQIKSDRALSEKMGAQGRLYAETHFSLEVCINQMGEILESVTGRG